MGCGLGLGLDNSGLGLGLGLGLFSLDSDSDSDIAGLVTSLLSCREDRMMICGIVLRQHRNVTDDRRHPHAI